MRYKNLIDGARVGPRVHQPSDHVRVTGDGGVMESRLVVRVERVQADVLDGVQQEVDDRQPVVPGRAHQ